MSGRAAYRGYKQHELFIGELEPEIEARAVARGSIEIVEAGPVLLDATRACLPRDWIKPEVERAQPAERSTAPHAHLHEGHRTPR